MICLEMVDLKVELSKGFDIKDLGHARTETFRDRAARSLLISTKVLE